MNDAFREGEMRDCRQSNLLYIKIYLCKLLCMNMEFHYHLPFPQLTFSVVLSPCSFLVVAFAAGFPETGLSSEQRDSKI